MRNWLMSIALAAAVVCPAATLRGQAPADEERAAAEVEAQRRHEAARLRELTEQGALGEAAAVAAQGQGRATARAMVARTKMEKAAWLGVRTSNVPTVIRQHLKNRNKYAGLLVEHVEPESPASEAGLQQFDIIEKVGDQWIVNKEQFGAVLRMQKTGEPVTLAIIREGEPTEVTAKLIERELPVLALGGVSQIEMVPLEVQGGVMNVAPHGQILIRDGEIQPMLPRWIAERNWTMTVQDPEHALTVTTTDGKRHLVAKDAAGTVLFEGPINTEQERAGVPAEIQGKLEKALNAAEQNSRPAPATAPAAPRQR